MGKTYHLFDFGVADINDDNWLDIYTLNHSVRQSILVNNARGEFTDQLLTLGLNQNRRFPGIGPSAIEPPIKDPGLYIYWYRSKLVVKPHNTSDFESITGQIRVPDSAVIKTTGGFEAATQKQDGKLAVNFTSQGKGQLTIESQANFFVPAFKLNERIPLEQIYLGSEQIHPDSHEFITTPGRDRHGMAWADLNEDGQTDVFIIRGGEGGRMKPDPVKNNDEFLLREENTFKDRTAESGILKDVCPGRQVALVDFNNDGQLDIFTGCGRAKPPRQQYPNQLHQQKAPGQFVDVAAESGLDIPEDGPFDWLDADNDQDMDLLFVQLFQNADQLIEAQNCWNNYYITRIFHYRQI
ncbi:MAG: VCBS repeat-containing protein, partial [Cyanobacteria bacterium J06626_14]